LIQKKNGKYILKRNFNNLFFKIIRLNITSRLETVATPTINIESTPIAIATSTSTVRLRLKRPRLDDDDDIVMTNGNGH
jgi:hypothetical protein